MAGWNTWVDKMGDGRVDEWMNEWIDEWMNEWVKGSVNVKNHRLTMPCWLARNTTAIKYYEPRNSNVFESGIGESAGNKIKSNLNEVKRNDPLNLAIALLSFLLVYLFTTLVPTPGIRPTQLVVRPLSRKAEHHRLIPKSKMWGSLLPCFPYACFWAILRPYVKDVLY